MLEFARAAHYLIMALMGALGSFAGATGCGKASLAALEAINIQPKAKNEIIRASILGLALIETSSILALIIIVIISFRPYSTIETVIAEGGIALAIGMTSCIAGITSSFPVRNAMFSIARQPFFAQKIINLMLITQSLIQTGVILSLLISIFINLQIDAIETSTQAFSLLAIGLAIGLGSLGPTLGLARFAETACACVSINRKSYGKILPFVFLSEAIIETPLIFSFLVVFIILFVAPTLENSALSIVRLLAASCCIGIGTLSPGINSSRIASQACYQIACSPQSSSILSQTSIIGQGLIDAIAIYALLISLGILFF